LEGSGITLQFLSRNIPRLQFSAIMTVAIGEAFEQLNAKNTLTTKQIEYIVSDLVARFGYITLDEVKILHKIQHSPCGYIRPPRQQRDTEMVHGIRP
jgi:hypothetical protein